MHILMVNNKEACNLVFLWGQFENSSCHKISNSARPTGITYDQPMQPKEATFFIGWSEVLLQTNI